MKLESQPESFLPAAMPPRLPLRGRARVRSLLRLALSLCVLLLPIVATWMLNSPPSYADTPATIVPVALAPTLRDTPVELVALTLDASISESDGHTFVTGNSTFKLHNTDKLNDFQTAVGFPGWAGDPYTFDPARLTSFAVTLEGKKVTLQPGKADFRIGGAVRNVDWYTFTVPLAADEKKTVRFEFQQDLGDSIMPRFTYSLTPATAWKGSIGSARITLGFPNATTLEQIVAGNPATSTFDGESVTWRFSSNEPPSNTTLALIRPSFWSELLARRRAVQQNPNDAAAQAALGGLYRQLALGDSARRDSYAAQAIAALEAATRIDPGLRAARQGLGALYELRAGPAAGPRQTAYVILAVTQWETLSATDAAARKQLAEDYFYLGMDSQTQARYADALAYFDKAAGLAPTGAGPLFTMERAANQRRALQIAWARTLLEQGDYAGAADKARPALGSAFMTSFAPPASYASHTIVTMAPGQRTTSLHMVPFSIRPAELETALAGIVASLQTTTSQANVSRDSSEVVLTIITPFADATDLTDALSQVVQALPDGANWVLLRAVASPQSITWNASGNLLNNTIRYQEDIDLAQACTLLERQLQAIETASKPLDSSSDQDTEGQLKRALLNNARSGWQLVRTNAGVSYHAGNLKTDVDACTARTVALADTPLRVDVIAAVGLALLVTVGLLGIAVVSRIRPRKRTKRQRGPQS